MTYDVPAKKIATHLVIFSKNDDLTKAQYMPIYSILGSFNHMLNFEKYETKLRNNINFIKPW